MAGGRWWLVVGGGGWWLVVVLVAGGRCSAGLGRVGFDIYIYVSIKKHCYSLHLEE